MHPTLAHSPGPLEACRRRTLLKALAAKAEKVRERHAAGRKISKPLFDRLEKIVGTFCPGLAQQPLHIDRFGGSHYHYGKGGHGHAH